MRIGFCDDDRFILSKMEQEIRKFMDGEGIECAFFALVLVRKWVVKTKSPTVQLRQ